MFQRGVAASRTGNFSFRLGQHLVVGVSSDSARDAFFTSPHSALGAGYGVINGEDGDEENRKTVMSNSELLGSRRSYYI